MSRRGASGSKRSSTTVGTTCTSRLGRRSCGCRCWRSPTPSTAASPRVSLLLSWFLTMGLTAALLWRVRRMLRPVDAARPRRGRGLRVPAARLHRRLGGAVPRLHPVGVPRGLCVGDRHGARVRVLPARCHRAAHEPWDPRDRGVHGRSDPEPHDGGMGLCGGHHHRGGRAPVELASDMDATSGGSCGSRRSSPSGSAWR